MNVNNATKTASSSGAAFFQKTCETPEEERGVDQKVREVIGRVLSGYVSLSDLVLSAAKKDDLPRVKALVELGANLDGIEENNDKKSCNGLFCKRDPKWEILDRSKRTALWYACENENNEMVELLATSGADVDKGKPICVAAYHGNVAAVKILQERGSRISPVFTSILANQLEVVEHLRDTNQLSGFSQKKQNTCIELAIRVGSASILNIFVPCSKEKNPGLDRFINRELCVCDHWRGGPDVSKVLQVLFEGGAQVPEDLIKNNLDIRNHFVFMRNLNKSIEQVLLEKFAENVSLQSEVCKNVLRCAIHERYHNVVKILIGRGMKVTYQHLDEAMNRDPRVRQLLRDTYRRQLRSEDFASRALGQVALLIV